MGWAAWDMGVRSFLGCPLAVLFGMWELDLFLEWALAVLLGIWDLATFLGYPWDRCCCLGRSVLHSATAANAVPPKESTAVSVLAVEIAAK